MADGSVLTPAAVLLREMDKCIGVTSRVSRCFVDYRGYALASPSTLNRMEPGDPEAAAHDRYKRIVARPGALDELLVELFVESYCRRFFHGYYGYYCHLPPYIFCGEHLLCARLRASNQDASAGSVEELGRIVSQIRRHRPGTRINIRGDSGFCRESIMQWCEANDAGFVLGLARNRRLVRALGAEMREKQPLACCRGLRCATGVTWGNHSLPRILTLPSYGFGCFPHMGGFAGLRFRV